MKKTILIFSLILFVFCNKKEDRKTEDITSNSLSSISEKSKFENTFENHLYIVGPHLDDNGNLELGCDCCSSQIYFYDSIHFIERAYCLEGDDLLIGKYEINEKGLQLKYLRKTLAIEFGDETDSLTLTNPKYTEIAHKGKELKTDWTKLKNTRFYNTTNDEVSELSDSLKNSFVKSIKEDKEVLKFLRKNNFKI